MGAWTRPLRPKRCARRSHSPQMKGGISGMAKPRPKEPQQVRGGSLHDERCLEGFGCNLG